MAITSDNSPLLMRDAGTQDIYSLDWESRKRCAKTQHRCGRGERPNFGAGITSKPEVECRLAITGQLAPYLNRMEYVPPESASIRQPHWHPHLTV